MIYPTSPCRLLPLFVLLGCPDPPGGKDTADTGSPLPDTDADGDGYSATDDCDDGDPLVHPGAEEVCDDMDNDCDNDVDEDIAEEYVLYIDDDGDGYGGQDTITDCAPLTPSSGLSETSDDCDDGDPLVHPGAMEWSDGVDNDCDAVVDEVTLSNELSTLEGSGSLALAEDVDRDGFAEILLGDSNYIGSLDNCGASGSVTVLPGPISDDLSIGAATMTFTGNNTEGDCFGYDVASGDIDGDDIPDIFTGAHADIDGVSTVYGFLGSSVEAGNDYTSLGADIALPSTNSNEYRGFSVLLADFSGDGFDDVIIGAPQEKRGTALNSFGAVRVYYADGRGGVETFNVFCGYSPATSAYTGFDISAGDISGDGAKDILVGSPYRSVSSGKVHIISGTDTALCEDIDTISAASFAGIDEGDILGYRVKVIGDVDGGGREDFVLSSIFRNDGAGEVYLFLSEDIAPDSTISDAHIVYQGVSAGDEAGRALDSIPDVDGDSRSELVISATGYTSSGEVERGAVYIVLSSSIGSPATVRLDTADATILGAGTDDRLGSALLVAPLYTASLEPLLVMGSSTESTYLLPLP